MNVLVACEYSGVVRDSFEDAGWNAWSCDILPTESEQTKSEGKHIQEDVMCLLYVENYVDFVEANAFFGVEAAKVEAAKNVFVFELSDREKNIINELNKNS